MQNKDSDNPMKVWPQKLKHFLTLFNTSEYHALSILIIMVLALHFATISTPKDAVFDEAYYVPAANSILHGLNLGRLEHPPLGQSIIASGIWLFGNNPFGWRFFSVIFGAISLVLFYFICRELKSPRYVALFATSLLAVDSLSFVLAGLAMLDVFCLTFMFASALFYLRSKPVWTGVFIGLAALSKLTGIFVLLFILFHWLFTKRKELKGLLITAGISIFTFIGGLTLLDSLILRQWENPLVQIEVMLSNTMNLTFAHSDPSFLHPTRPWEWLYRLNGNESIAFDAAKAQFYNQLVLIINPAIWALIIPAVAFLTWLAFRKSNIAIFAVCWFSAVYMVWVPVSMVTGRLTYDYYFYPVVSAICLGISLLFSRIQNLLTDNQLLSSVIKIIAPLYLGVSILFFVFLYNPGNIWFRMSWAIILFIITLYYLDKFTLEEPIRDTSLS